VVEVKRFIFGLSGFDEADALRPYMMQKLSDTTFPCPDLIFGTRQSCSYERRRNWDMLWVCSGYFIEHATLQTHMQSRRHEVVGMGILSYGWAARILGTAVGECAPR
jgi:hypothetical protein